MNDTSMQPEVFGPRCPTCDMQVALDAADKAAGKHLPFCSERCRLRDLGRWLNEEHALPCEDDTDDSEGSSAESGQTTPRLPPGWHDA